ncbi:phosphatase PAP2 family protein [Hymenobacter sp. UV11]|uniref:vanadium-dependent haloperoxidase n=1 Tax=Hymenobacter sp. UV11 TaxID=1849735 RepID=UPI001060AAE2|nr:vanadium-dependent haloperoxidase [Hymenobacter sp. UV11]TDN36651.1 hypothetical protein A8B98_08165 [Hymenobacter sp. UV11]TFZ66156.1 phosphatase PAP2 family protein [Hymenobacter sp. UV11]
MLTPPVTPPPGNVILAWNNIYLDLVRHIGGAPGPLARIGALMHLAMYEVVNRLTPGNQYPTLLPPPTKPAPPLAAAGTSAAYAACFVLTEAIKSYVTAARKMQGEVLDPFDPFQVLPGLDPQVLGLAVHTDDTTNGVAQAYGQEIAQLLLAKYPADTGLETAVEPMLDAETPGEWRPTDASQALTPHWGKLPLFFLSKPAAQYHPTAIPAGLYNYPDLLKSMLYAMQLAEVKLLGEAHSTARTPTQTEIAFFWANDLNGTSKPPGQLYTITQTLAQQAGIVPGGSAMAITTTGQLLETARLFALAGTAMVNASIVAWQAKYYSPNSQHPMRLWRPETAIHLATEDGNPSTVAEATWQPLSAQMSGTRFSPNFPAYVSGHSTFGAAWAAAMHEFFGTNAIAFTATTEDPHALRDENGVRRTRSFTSFTQAALENGRSRVYLGVHYQFDANGGFEIGTKVGQDTAVKFRKTP